ncbi:MAG: hypothetical protein COU90_01865 [Candidatus Ryanbacteria bacterium CG10_big_fil_rev_8_21_14_0_10_43_42]|uniref:Glycosyltransferase family 1 protein n=1 Tax=Candidatus Ryanbacteria bacterium CG10_big_fil_rev_8_21_14_0_10_43_42 TaxID=1974864 RepID=A0A2M8KXA6_9BACT|nr:MAG: hypothetical protein COU90_01865 [Candidatus Ryanbacteria bacterium CG10_big_fil_rev_8_21_14_0_10_43_42]
MEDNPHKRIRVLYVITKSVWGGAGKYVYDLATHADIETYDVAVALGGTGDLAKRLEDANISTFDVENFQKSVNPFKEIGALFELLSILYEFHPHVVHANSSKAGGLTGVAVFIYRLLTGNRPKTLFTVHGWAFLEHRPAWDLFLRRLASRLTARFQDVLIVISQKDKAATLSYNIAPAQKVTLIQNGIIPPEFMSREQVRQKLGVDPSVLVIGCIAEWTANKGILYLLRAYRDILQKFPETKLVLIGWGEDEEDLRKKSKDFGVEESVLFISLSPAAPYLKAFDIFVLPSLKEGLPYTILEAGLAEIPVIASRVGGIPDIIEHETHGLLVDPASSTDLSFALIRLLSRPDLRIHLAKTLHAHVCDMFSFNTMLDRTTALYQDEAVSSQSKQE